MVMNLSCRNTAASQRIVPSCLCRASWLVCAFQYTVGGHRDSPAMNKLAPQNAQSFQLCKCLVENNSWLGFLCWKIRRSVLQVRQSRPAFETQHNLFVAQRHMVTVLPLSGEEDSLFPVLMSLWCNLRVVSAKGWWPCPVVEYGVVSVRWLWAVRVVSWQKEAKRSQFSFFWSALDNQKSWDCFSWKAGRCHKGNWVLGTLCVLVSC